jgi:hypothetical protein
MLIRWTVMDARYIGRDGVGSDPDTHLAEGRAVTDAADRDAPQRLVPTDAGLGPRPVEAVDGTAPAFADEARREGHVGPLRRGLASRRVRDPMDAAGGVASGIGPVAMPHRCAVDLVRAAASPGDVNVPGVWVVSYAAPRPEVVVGVQIVRLKMT